METGKTKKDYENEDMFDQAFEDALLQDLLCSL